MSNSSQNHERPGSMSKDILAMPQPLPIIILRVLRYAITVGVVFYATYELGPELKEIRGDLERFGVEAPWYTDALIWVSDVVVIYTARCAILTMIATGFYLYAGIRLVARHRAAWVALEIIDTGLLVIVIALLGAGGAGLESMLIQYYFTTQPAMQRLPLLL